MNLPSGPEFDALPELIKHDQISDNITELPQTPGAATALFEGVTDAADRWHEHAEATGDIHLSTFDGQLVTIHRLERGKEGIVTNPTPQKVAVRGIRGWLQRRRQAQNSVHHTITFSDGDTATQLSNVRLSNGVTSLRGRQMITTDKGTETIELHEGMGLEDAADRARELVANGFPFSAEAAIAERQQQPCAEIIGNEAVQLQKALEAIIDPNKAAELGDKTAPTRVTSHEIIQPNVTDQWSAKSLIVVEQGAVAPVHSKGNEGRSILSTVNFSDELMNAHGDRTTLLARVEGVYEQGTNNLLSARVMYRSKLGVLKAEEPLELGPEDRQAVHAAIMRQLTPDNVMRTHTHEFKSE